jgi:DNA-binding transcriptional regulator YdaS (Cro superfamily)
MRRTILQRAIAAEPFDGNQSRFAEAIGTSQQNISNWLRKGAPLPAEYVLKAEAATGIERHKWRPDIYPAPLSEASAPQQAA